MPIKETIRCAIVMAGGDGQRLRPFVHELRQKALPKQYVNFIGRRSMLEHTIDRAQRIVPMKHIVTVVSESHLDLSEARQQLSVLPRESVVVQPLNRGTWAGLLLPLARIYEKYPEATVVMFPSDHFILQEEMFLAHVIVAIHRVEEQPERMVLLGSPPDNPDPEFGYIIPRAPRRPFPPSELLLPKELATLNESPGLDYGQIVPLMRRGPIKPSDFLTIKDFVEKPSQETARDLIVKNALWNTGIFVAKATTLVRYTREFAPELYTAFLRMKKILGTTCERAELRQVYRNINDMNFSRDFLEILPSRYPLSLLTLPVEQVFWSDWGSKGRLLAVLNKTGYQMRLNRGAKPVAERASPFEHDHIRLVGHQRETQSERSPA
ncbi:MAG: sugar phosphate nucleotidyltransferase [Candidatus Binatia bacterium]